MAGPVKTNFEGGDQMSRNLHNIRDRYPNKVRGGLKFRAEVIMTDSKNNFVPVDWGNLKSSGHVLDPGRGMSDLIFVQLVYGGPSEPYAVTQHEVFYDHVVGQWKYLETPINNALPTLLQDLAKDIQLTQDLAA